jgi:hypothetical protein
MVDVPVDEYGLADVQGEHGCLVRGPGQPPGAGCRSAQVRASFGRRPMQLEFSLPTVGASYRAVQHIPRISPQVACLRRPGHGADEQLALGEVGLDGADAGGSVAAQCAQQCHARRVQPGYAEPGKLRRAQFHIPPVRQRRVGHLSDATCCQAGADGVPMHFSCGG